VFVQFPELSGNGSDGSRPGLGFLTTKPPPVGGMPGRGWQISDEVDSLVGSVSGDPSANMNYHGYEA